LGWWQRTGRGSLRLGNGLSDVWGSGGLPPATVLVRACYLEGLPG
jgi:hypothetical protein